METKTALCMGNSLCITDPYSILQHLTEENIGHHVTICHYVNGFSTEVASGSCSPVACLLLDHLLCPRVPLANWTDTSALKAESHGSYRIYTLSKYIKIHEIHVPVPQDTWLFGKASHASL